MGSDTLKGPTPKERRMELARKGDLREKNRALRRALEKIATIRTTTMDPTDDYHQLVFCVETAQEALA